MRSLLLALALMLAAIMPASAGVLAKVDLSSQHMKVYVNGKYKYTWPVSTGKKGHRTPLGTYTVYRMSKHHISRKYNNAPMPNSLFFRGGYAVHGTYSYKSLGRWPASRGCVRLSPSNSRILYNLAAAHGMRNTTVQVKR